MIFSKLLLTSGIPVMVFFFCSNNFEQKLEVRLKLLTYSENIEQHVNNGGNLQQLIDQVPDNSHAVKAFYTDSNWIKNVAAKNSIDSIPAVYSGGDSICLSLHKTSRVNYNEVSAATENFEAMRPFITDGNQFMCSNILHGPADTLQYRITEMNSDTASPKYIRLSFSGKQMSKAPSLLAFPRVFIFWTLLVVALAICYQSLKYTVNKIFGIRIPGNEDFKGLNEILLRDDRIKYLFVQGISGSGKTKFIKTNLEANDKYQAVA